MNYNEASQLTHSEKITFVTIESVERVKLFSQDGSDWTRSSEFFVVGVKDNGVSITGWNFNPLTKVLTIIGGADPKTRNISLTYRHFFSTSPYNLPYDLNNGAAVEWLPFITGVGSVGQSLDEESTGVVLETSSSVTMINQGYFDEIFDFLIFENQSVKIYSWFPNIPISERVQLFEGVIESKDFSPASVTFKTKDFIYRLKTFLNLGLFSGQILPSLVGTPRRRIYGQVDNVKCVSLDATLSGYNLTGTITGSIATRSITGTGTLFLKELSVGDEIIVTIGSDEIKFGVEEVISDTSITVNKDLSVGISLLSARVKPLTPYRLKNRTWEIAGHKLREPTAEILTVLSSNRFELDSVGDLFPGDIISINGVTSAIRRIVGNVVVCNSNISPIPSNGDFLIKSAVSKVYFKDKALLLDRDYTVTNTSSASVILDDLAEFNIAEDRSFGINLNFTNGSRSITTSATVDLRSILKPRDWIKSELISEPFYYEVLDVKEQEIIVRIPFVGTTGTKGGLYRSVEYIDENSLITANCLGLEYQSTWAKTPSDCVRHMILSDAGFASVNEASFAKAKVDCDHIVSMVIPETLGSEAPSIRDTITKINESVFGSLYGDSSQNISYSILNATKPESTEILKDDDIISFSVATNQRITNQVKVNYRPYTDVFNGEDAFKTIVQTSDFVDNLIGIENSTEKTIYLYEDSKAKIMAQRILMFNSLSNASIKIRSKLNLAKTLVNDKIYLSLDRLYKRYSGQDKRKLAIVTSVKIDGYNVDLTLTDLGNIFNRVASIAPNSTPVYTSADQDQKLKWGFIVSNTTETPDESSEVGLGSNVIG